MSSAPRKISNAFHPFERLRLCTRGKVGTFVGTMAERLWKGKLGRKDLVSLDEAVSSTGFVGGVTGGWIIDGVRVGI